MLEFNPHFRPSAYELLQHKWFDDIRNLRLEKGAPFKINLKCDQINTYDYAKYEDHYCKDINDYLALILIEVKKLKRKDKQHKQSFVS